MRNKIEKLLTRIIIISLIASFSIGSPSVRGISTAQGTFWPGTSSEWTEVAPETQGIDPDKIAEMFDFINITHYEIYSIIITRNGYLLLEEYLQNSQIYRNMTGDKEYWFGGFIHDQASTTKSLTSILIGIAIQEGFLNNVNQTLYEFYSDIWQPTFTDSELKKNITIEQILTMNAGFVGDDQVPPGSKTANAVDCIEWALDDLPLVYTPGQEGQFEYSSDSINLLSGIITNLTGQSAKDFAKEYLFEPLHISENEYNWFNDSKGITYGGYLFQCSPKVQAKLGILCLNDGNWDGTQIVDENFIKNATTYQVPGEFSGYGYLFYMDAPHDGYFTYGSGGQCIFVIPKYDIVVGFTGSNMWLQYHGLINSYIAQFVDPPEIPDDPAIPGFELNLTLLIVFCTTAVLIIWRKKYPKK